MAIHKPRTAAKLYDLFQYCSNCAGQVQGANILSIDQADGAPSIKVCNCDRLDSTNCLCSVAIPPVPSRQAPLDLRLRPIIGEPEPDSSNDGAPGKLDNCIWAITAQRPMASGVRGSPGVSQTMSWCLSGAVCPALRCKSCKSRGVMTGTSHDNTG